MKKTMFITSVIMVVVMAIALTTSSLAWFSANGSSQVTTDALQLTATGQASSGLKISDDSITWGSSVSMGSAVTGMNPVLPYETSEDKSILEALVANHFITNTIDGDHYDAVPNTTTASDYTLNKTIYVANYDAADNKHLTVSIAWKDANGDAYTHQNGKAVLCVAVLANVNPSTKADRTTASAAEWELLNIFTSDGANAGAGSGASVRYGKGAEAFAAPSGNTLKYVGDSYYTLDIDAAIRTEGEGYENDYKTNGGAVGNSTLNLAMATVVDGEQLSYGDVQEFKVIAWYDGIMLKNANSGGTSSPFGLQFALTFEDSDS